MGPAVVATVLLACLAGAARADVCAIRPTLQLYDGYSSRGKGSLRDEVRELQAILNKNGASLTVDGYFGYGTRSAVRSYQSSKSLTVDGIVGPQTWGSLCSSSSPTSCSVSNPYGASTGACGGYTSRATFVRSTILSCFPNKFYCSTYCSSSRRSDHRYGNAMDCFPGKAGEYASGQDKRDGDALAAWCVKNAVQLKVKYVIWREAIWSYSRRSEGWRACGSSAATCDASGAATASHYDHLHISIY